MKRFLLYLLLIAAIPTAQAGIVNGNLQTPSGLPVKNGTLTFVLQQVGMLSGSGLIASTTSQCYTSSGGQVVGTGDPTALPKVAVTTGSGVLPGGIYWVQYSYVNALGAETLPSPELRVQLTSTGAIQITPPASIPSGATGIRIYAGTASGNETLQGVGGLTSVFSLGAPLVSGTSPLTVNSTVCNIAFNDTISPYQGYSVSLTSANGNAYPGWPQSWQLNGGQAGTVNVSSGAPLYNGTVVYPTPLLSQPLNRGPQSISGPLDHGGYNDTNVGTASSGIDNSVVNANLQSGIDIGDKINASLQVCGSDCTVYVPAGQYSFVTPIVLPMNTLGTFSLVLDDGAVLSYTGSSACAITGSINTGGPTVTNLRIRGGQLFGNASSPCGIHILPSNSVSISGMLINGFSSGDGIWIDGANGVNVSDNRIFSNKVGVYATNTSCNGSTCSPTTVGSVYTPNAIWIHHNVITANTNWGVQFFDAFTNGSTGALNDVVEDNDLELNGGAGPTFGAVTAGRTTGFIVAKNYFEGSPRQVVLGFPGSPGPFFGSLGAVVRDNYFTLLNTTPYEIELQDSTNAVIEGNSTLGATIQPTGACFLNETQAVGTFFSKNHVITGASGSTGTVAPICQGGTPENSPSGAGSFSLTNQNYFPRLTYQNFIITAAASDTQAAQFVTGSDACYASASGASAGNVASAQTIIASVYVVPGTGQFTIYHPTGQAGLQYNVWCSGTPN